MRQRIASTNEERQELAIVSCFANDDGNNVVQGPGHYVFRNLTDSFGSSFTNKNHWHTMTAALLN